MFNFQKTQSGTRGTGRGRQEEGGGMEEELWGEWLYLNSQWFCLCLIGLSWGGSKDISKSGGGGCGGSRVATHLIPFIDANGFPWVSGTPFATAWILKKDKVRCWQFLNQRLHSEFVI